MKFLAISCLLAFSARVNADDLGLGGLGAGLVYAPKHASVDYYAYPRYAFEYAVKDPHTGDNKAQWEKRDGDVVKGAYSLVEPDGSLRVVEYYADDKSGFNAVVKRLGPNLHPVAPVVAPIYKAPIPVLSSGAIAPISVGPISKYGGLANAPLITGPGIYKGGVSTASIINHGASVAPILPAPIAPIVKAPILSAPILPAPIYKTPIAPILSAPIYKENILPVPIYKEPVLPAPIYKEPILPGPVLSNPYLGGPVYKSAPILNAPGPIISPLLGYNSLGLGGLDKGSILSSAALYNDLGLVGKGPLVPALGPWDLGLGYKQ
ncbi:uncharacterized protein LOC128677502 [Plodia interpunctella]|uniref:uncharacterized protein LOC128677502 n=1 Tax=Plodia interpunctella TaxID=58824 RepID=UPI002367DD99|nr:uncharacterized protein LOC128677502 [Plodia interpunctella]